MAERDRIARYFAPLAQAESGSFSLTDDTAVLTPPAGQQLVITTDSVIEAIHVLPQATPQQFAQKLMRRNLSDLAAMGATPWRYTLNVHTPRGLPDSWFAAFADTLAQEQAAFGVVLVGGDSTSGAADASLHVTMTLFGLLTQPPLRRNGAQAGDDLYVSGTLGDAAVGLQLLQHSTENAFLTDRYHTPQPRLALGAALHGIATAALDISDGLLADVVQLCTASHVGVQLQRDALPRSAALQPLLDADASLWNAVLNGGDDYELCFTAPATMRERIAALATQLGLPLTRIGVMTETSNIVVVDAQGVAVDVSHTGWEHS